MDPGSNVHICNNKEAWKWTHTRYGKPSEVILAGSTTLPITEWGTVIVPIKGPQSTITPALLTDVAYIEGFFTNILSLARLKGQHIHFDSGRNLLYRQNPKHTAAFLEYRDGHWLIDADPSSRPNPSAMMTMAASRRTRPSRDPKRDLKVTPTQAQQLWGHAAPSAIAHLHNAVRGIQVIGVNQHRQLHSAINVSCPRCTSWYPAGYLIHWPPNPSRGSLLT
jgi:hypothetical protein